MNIHNEKIWLLQSRVLILIVILLIIGSLSGSIPVVFFSALFLTVSVVSSVYQRSVQNKVIWQYKKYFESTSIDECFDVFLELKNESVFPIFNFTINIESRNEEGITVYRKC
jgi:hypothetical protein